MNRQHEAAPPVAVAPPNPSRTNRRNAVAPQAGAEQQNPSRTSHRHAVAWQIVAVLSEAGGGNTTCATRY